MRNSCVNDVCSGFQSSTTAIDLLNLLTCKMSVAMEHSYVENADRFLCDVVRLTICFWLACWAGTVAAFVTLSKVL